MLVHISATILQASTTLTLFHHCSLSGLKALFDMQSCYLLLRTKQWMQKTSLYTGGLAHAFNQMMGPQCIKCKAHLTLLLKSEQVTRFRAAGAVPWEGQTSWQNRRSCLVSNVFQQRNRQEATAVCPRCSKSLLSGQACL